VPSALPTASSTLHRAEHHLWIEDVAAAIKARESLDDCKPADGSQGSDRAALRLPLKADAFEVLEREARPHWISSEHACHRATWAFQ
jgi:hypothetical protein